MGPFSGSAPFDYTGFPADACEGNVTITITGPVDNQGIIFDIFINGGFFASTSCMTNGSTFPISIPANATELQLSGTTGCGGGAGVPTWVVVGSGS